MQINDLGLAVALYTAGFELSSIDSQDPKRAVFNFDKESEQLKRSVADYFAGELKLDAKKIYENIIVLKKRISEETRNNSNSNESYNNDWNDRGSFGYSKPRRKSSYRSYERRF